jgi:rhamnosyl/mannosyltransferase
VPKNVLLVVHWHADIIKQKNLLYLVKFFIMRTLMRADRILVSAESLTQRSEFLTNHHKKVILNPFGTDVDFWGRLSPEDHAEVDHLKSKEPRIVISVARLVGYKGLEVLVAAMRSVRGKCIIVGEGVLEDKLRSLIFQYSLQDRVFILKNQSDAEIRKLLHSASLFVLPSVSAAEAFGLAQLEAMAVGLPIVNTNLPTGVPWVARDGQEAITVTPGHVEQLAEAINRILDDNEVRKQLGFAARIRAAENFQISKFVETYVKIFSGDRYTGK